MQEKEAERKQAELEAAKRALDAKKAEEQQKESELSQIRDKIKGAPFPMVEYLLQAGPPYCAKEASLQREA